MKANEQTAQEIFDQHFRTQEQTISEEDFQEVLHENSALRENYINRIFESTYTPSKILLAIRAVINQADHVRNEIIQRAKGLINKAIAFPKKIFSVLKGIRGEEEHWGRQAVAVVMAACGISGFGNTVIVGSASALSVVMEAAANLVAKVLGVFSKDFCIRCGACGEKIWKVVRRGERCPKSNCNAVRQC